MEVSREIARRASDDSDLFTVALSSLEQQLQTLLLDALVTTMTAAPSSTAASTHSPDTGSTAQRSSEGEGAVAVANPPKMPHKGRPKIQPERRKSVVEVAVEKVKKLRHCSRCGDTNHNIRKCPQPEGVLELKK